MADQETPRTIESVQLEREEFDLLEWKKRSPLETTAIEISLDAERQQIVRRNAETLVSVLKTTSISDAVKKEANDKLLEVIKGIKTK